MTTYAIVGIAALVCVSACGLLSALIQIEMVEMVNRRLPKGTQFESLGWYWPKTLRLIREYRSLYPEGDLLLRFRTLIALGVACLLVSAWGFGFFGK